MKILPIIVVILANILCSFVAEGKFTESENDYSDTLQVSTDTLRKHSPRSAGYFMPVLKLRGNSLFIMNYIPSCTLQLVDEAGNIFYETVIPEGTEQWQLPTDHLEGCELRLIVDDVCYYCVL